MLTSQKIAIAAHLHVLLRRKTGRVTDTEWMATNLEYALEIVRFARASAAQDGHADLAEWADRLEAAVRAPAPVAHRPLAQAAAQILKERAARPAMAPASQPQPPSTGGFGHSTQGDTGFAESTLDEAKAAKPAEPSGPRYVGGIR